MSSETPLGLSLINDPHLLPPHLKITVKSKTSFISPLQLVSQDLMAKLKTKFHHHFCAVKTFCRRSREMVFSRTPPARNPELNFSKKHQDDSI
ncbi:hypothetical protein TNCV_239021 [Trichonephila clavipes]|nr:hypothetical protein TNCV_239021 [Trichonephila clavipes]